jgi:uncharacterized membrane protein
MGKSFEELDGEQLRHCVRLGGLEISAERAAKLLALANALLKGCARLEALDLTAKGGSGPLAPWGGVK